MRALLMAWYDQSRRDLPWRRRRNVYRTWVSEVMLQQTRVDQAAPYFERFIERFPDVETLSKSDLDSVLVAWEGLGYYARARNLHAAATIVAEAGFPTDYDGWRSLPGVGDYTASSVSSIAYGEARAAVDGNVSRVISRLFAITHEKGTRAFQRTIATYAAELLDPDRPGDFNEAMMDLGASVCQHRNPACRECPLSANCIAAMEGKQSDYPRRAPRRSTPHFTEAAAVLTDREGRLLLRRRPEEGLLGGLWELPTSRLSDGDVAELALRANLESLGVGTVHVGDHITTVDHAYSHFRVTIRAYACRHTDPNAATEYSNSDGLAWHDEAGLLQVAMPRAHRKVLESTASA